MCDAYQYGEVGADNVGSSSHLGLYKKKIRIVRRAVLPMFAIMNNTEIVIVEDSRQLLLNIILKELVPSKYLSDSTEPV